MNGRWFMLAALAAAAPAFAGAPVAPEGRFARVVNEEAIIVWDEGAKREHLIHRVSFDTNATSFGFLVPAPARPELGEADDRAFTLVGGISWSKAPAEVVRSDRPSAATLLEQAPASQGAAVLEAGEVEGWVKEKGYAWSADLAEWLAPYAAAKWKIAAFKVAAVATSALRLSFQAEKPFFPYREPASQRKGGEFDRALVVYVLGDLRFDGMPAGSAVWSNAIDKAELAELLRLAGLPILAGGGGLRLTRFEDFSSPRAGTEDVFFAPAASQAALGPPGNTPRRGEASWRLLGPALAIVLVALLAYALWRFLRRRNG